MNGTYKKRSSNIELYRIIVMLLIVAHHYVVNSGLTDIMAANSGTIKSDFLYIFGAWGKTGINCFVLITGYFMCKSDITLRKFIKLLGEIMFYRIVIFIVFAFAGKSVLTPVSLIKLLVPVSSVTNNFAGSYITFFLCIPFINILIRNLKERTHTFLIVLSLFIYTFMSSVPWFDVSFNYVGWFIVLYFISSYIRMYPKEIFGKTKLWIVMTVLSILLSVASVLLMERLSIKHVYFFLSDSNKILALTNAVCSFILFLSIDIKYSSVINTVAASTFGVLLIHASSNNMRQWLWRDTLKNVQAFDSQYWTLHALGSVVGIFVVCTLIDYLRILFIEKPFFTFWDKQSPKLISWYKKNEKRICKKLNIDEV